jgi:hypothetical protein
MKEVQKDLGGSVGLQVIQERMQIRKQLKDRNHASLQDEVNIKQ